MTTTAQNICTCTLEHAGGETNDHDAGCPQAADPQPAAEPQPSVTTEIVEQPKATVAESVEFTEGQKQLIAAMMDEHATPAELEAFLYVCARTGLDPITRQIYAIRRKGRLVYQAGIDGFRVIAARTGMMAGNDQPEYGPDVQAATVNGVAPEWASVTVYRLDANGDRQAYTATLYWEEYAPNLADDQAFMWRKMPRNQLAKCAEAAALRKGFPNELGGVYSPEEMDQADYGRQLPAGQQQDNGWRCPTCAQHGIESGIVDQRGNRGEGDKRPAFRCQAGKRCAAVTKQGQKFGWGTWDEDHFDQWPDPDSIIFDEIMNGMGADDVTVPVLKKYAYLLSGKRADVAATWWREALLNAGVYTDGDEGPQEQAALDGLDEAILKRLVIEVYDVAAAHHTVQAGTGQDEEAQEPAEDAQ